MSYKFIFYCFAELSPDAEDNQSITASPASDKRKPSRRQTGWGTATSQPADVFDSRLVQRTETLDDDDDEIQVIPDLDDMRDEEMAEEVAAPPSSNVTKMASYRYVRNYYHPLCTIQSIGFQNLM